MKLKILATLLASSLLYAGDSVPLTEFVEQGAVVTTPDGRGKAVEINGATKFQVKVLGKGTPSPYSNTGCVYFVARKYHKLKDGSFDHIKTLGSDAFDGVVTIGDRRVKPTIINFSKKFRPILKTRGDVQTEEYCLVPNQVYPMVIRVFGSAQPPDKSGRVKTMQYYHAEFGPQDW